MTKLLSLELLESAASGNLEGVTAALEKGADLWAENLSGQNALALAMAHQEEDLALVLLGRMAQHKPDLGWMLTGAKGTGNNAIHQAIVGRCYRVMNALLKMAIPHRSMLLGGSNADGFTPLLLAIQSQADRYASALLKVDPGLLEKVANGFSPLALAVNEDKESLVDALLAAGASALLPPSMPAWSRIQSMDMMERLAKQVDYATVKTAAGENILHVLASRGTDLKMPLLKAVLRLVIPRAEGILSEQCERGKTVLHTATASRCSVAVVELLVDEGAVWSSLDAEGRTPLDWAQTAMASGKGSPYTEDTLKKWHAQGRQQHLEQGLPPADPALGRVRF